MSLDDEQKDGSTNDPKHWPNESNSYGPWA